MIVLCGMWRPCGHAARSTPQHSASAGPRCNNAARTPHQRAGASRPIPLAPLRPSIVALCTPVTARRLSCTPLSAVLRDEAPLCALGRLALVLEGHTWRILEKEFGEACASPVDLLRFKSVFGCPRQGGEEGYERAYVARSHARMHTHGSQR